MFELFKLPAPSRGSTPARTFGRIGKFSPLLANKLFPEFSELKIIFPPKLFPLVSITVHVGRKSKRKLTSFIHLRKKAKNRLFSSIFSSLLILFSIREKRWHGEHRKRKHQQKNYEFAPASTRPRLILFRASWTRRDFIFFFEKHPQKCDYFSRRFFFCWADFNFPFSIFFSRSLLTHQDTRTLTHAICQLPTLASNI